MCESVLNVMEVFSLISALLSLFQFSVVEFLNEDDDTGRTSLEVVPTKWLLSDKMESFYPPAKDKCRVSRLAMSLADFNPLTWRRLRVKFHHSYGKNSIYLKLYIIENS